MNREIKFRAWVKEVYENGELQYGGHMVYDIHSLNFTKVTNLMTGVTPIGISCFVPGLFYGHIEKLTLEEIELMEYTGLKDKHGVEIYEGDVIKTVYEDEEYGDIDEFVYVSWCEDGYWCVREDERKLLGMLVSHNGGDFEVVGNIHEHPHLLEGAGHD